MGSPTQVGAAPGKSSRLQPVQDDRLGDDDMRAELEAAKADIGWSQRGGQIIRDPRTAIDPNSPTAHLEGDVVGRTPWIGSDLWRNRPTEGGRVNEAEASEAIDKALRGEPMNARQRRFVQHALDTTVERLSENERRLFDALDDAKMEAEQGGDEGAIERFWASVAEIEAQEERDAIEVEGPADAEDGGRAGGTEEASAAVAPQGAGAAEAQARPAGGDTEGLTLSAQSTAELQAKADREAAAKKADTDEQKRLADKAKADSQRDEFTLTGSDRPADVAAAAGQMDLLAPVADAAPLYASRPVTNAADIIAWAASQGFKTTLKPEDLHVTIAYSRDPVDCAKAGAADAGVSIAGGARTVEPLGDQGAVVLKFASPELQARWKQYRDAGASWDYDSYTPHVTLTYDGAGVDLAAVEPYTGLIELGPEKQEPLNVDKADDYKADDYKAAGEAPTAQAPRETPEPAAEAAQPATRNAALVEARKRLSVLQSLAKCLA